MEDICRMDLLKIRSQVGIKMAKYVSLKKLQTKTNPDNATGSSLKYKTSMT